MADFTTTIHELRQRESHVHDVRVLGMEERAALLDRACAAASKLEAARVANGFGASRASPWPSSTIELLRRTTADALR